MISGNEQRRRKAVEAYADATRESYRMVVDRAFAARESNPRLTRDFFERTTVEIQEQARLNRCAMEQLASHIRKQGEALGPDVPDDMYSFLGPPPDRMRN